MPTSLPELNSRLCNRLVLLSGAFERQPSIKAGYKRIERYAVQEGLISTLWQVWGFFCREMIIHSTGGGVTANGLGTTSQYAALAIPERIFVARQFATKSSIKNIRPIAGSHLEPTWGDVSKMSHIITGINPNNAMSLLKGLGSAVSLRDLQTCRNSSAHLNSDTVQEVKATRVRYSGTAMQHPSDMLYWIEPSTQDYLWRTWVSDMRSAALAAVQ